MNYLHYIPLMLFFSSSPFVTQAQLDLITNGQSNIPMMPSTAFDGTIVRHEEGLTQFHGGEVVFEPGEVPVIGSLEAQHLVAGIFDYTCDHCRKMRRSLFDLQRNYGTDLGIVQLPGIKSREESQGVQGLMLTAFYADPPFYKELAKDIFYEKTLPYEDTIRERMIEHWGREQFDAYTEKHAGLILDVIDRTLKVVELNLLQAQSMQLPQLMVGNKVTVGVPDDPKSYYNLIETHLGMPPKFPILGKLPESTSLGTVFAGTILNMSLPLVNEGSGPLVLGKATVPPGATITEHPNKPIQPGERHPLSVQLRIPPKGGPLDWFLEIVCNTYPAKTTIALTGEVFAPLTFEPEEVSFSKENPTPASVQVLSDAAFTPGDLGIQHPDLKGTLTPIEQGRHYELQLERTGNKGPSGVTVIKIPVQGKDPSKPWPTHIEFPVRLND